MWKGSKVQRLKGSKVQRFKGSEDLSGLRWVKGSDLTGL